jgi:CARDB
VSTHDDDILDFDFFDEEEPTTWEEPSTGGTRPPGGRGPRPPRQRFRLPGNLTPLLRLVGLIALAILIIVLLAVWVEGCSTSRKHDRYANYMTQIGAVGSASAKIGDQLSTLLTTPGLNQEDLDAKLGGYVQQAQSLQQKAEGLRPPGPLHDANDAAVQSLGLRVLGLQGLQAAFKQTAGSSDATAAGEQLAVQGQRLSASDVVWADLFRSPAQAVLQDEGVDGVQVPASVMVPTVDLVTQRSLAAIWQRIQGASTGGTPTGSHGSGIAYVKALPGGQLLSTTTQTTIKVTTQLGFEVGVTDTGDSQEVSIKVTLTIPKPTNPIVKTSTIPVIDPGETKAVTFTIGALVPFGEQISVKVDVTPVKGETNTSNNTYEYPVIFTL